MPLNPPARNLRLLTHTIADRAQDTYSQHALLDRLLHRIRTAAPSLTHAELVPIFNDLVNAFQAARNSGINAAQSEAFLEKTFNTTYVDRQELLQTLPLAITNTPPDNPNPNPVAVNQCTVDSTDEDDDEPVDLDSYNVFPEDDDDELPLVRDAAVQRI